MDFAEFLARLRGCVDPVRLDKALAMLKAERFQLYAEVEPDEVLGVVQAQSSGARVYSCRLTREGDYFCCTQQVRRCEGLHWALCKHLLVLLVGLTKAGRLDAAAAEQWARASRPKCPTLDRDRMSAVLLRYATLLRYKGTEVEPLDWRPTETIPEDYYAY